MAAFAATNHLQFNGPGLLTIKSFFSDSSIDKTLQVRFSSGKALVPVPKPAGIQAGNFNYACYTDSTKQKSLGAGVLAPGKNLNELVTAETFLTVLMKWL